MNEVLAPVVHLLPLTHIRRERILPVPGKILVRKGQKVGANDVVAEARLNAKHLLLDVAVGLAVQRNRAEQYIRVKPGDQLAEGDLLAGPAGFGHRVLRAPGNSRVILVGSDEILLELAEGLSQVKAGITGEVVELIADYGVVIETTGALIQGVWGNNRVDYGLLTVLAHDPAEVLIPQQLDDSLRGAVIMSGHCQSSDTLQLAARLPVRGLILASMSIKLLPLAASMEYPIILLEGCGDLGMNKLAFKLLTTSERREVSINAQERDIHLGRHPEIVIPLPVDREITQPGDAVTFSPDQQVRSVRSPYEGSVGRLVHLSGVVSFPSGIRAQAAEVIFDDGELVLLPLENLEVFA